MKKDELIQSHIKGLLTKKQIQEYERLLSEDTAFAKAVAEHKDMVKAIKEHERKELKKQLEILESTTTKKIQSTINWKKWTIAASVLFFIGILSYQGLNKINSSEKLYADYFEPYPNALRPITRGENAAKDSQFNVFLAYENGKYANAAAGFAKLYKSDKNPDIRFYYAMSLLNNGEVKNAKKELQQLKKDTTLFIPQVYWYSALIALKNGDKKSAIEQLDSLKQLKAEYKDISIQKLLEVLK